MKKQILVTDIDMPNEDSNMMALSFNVFKKSFFGGMKRDHSFDGFRVCMPLKASGEINVERTNMIDFNRSFDAFYLPSWVPELTLSVMSAAVIKLSEQGDEKTAEKIRVASLEYCERLSSNS